MFRRYRQRRGPYAMAAPSAAPSVIRSVILLLIVAFILYYAGRWVLWLFGGGNELQRSAVVMQVEGRSAVSVSLEGGLLQRAEDSLKLYPGDRVTTGGNGHALLSFFDGSKGRLDVQSDMSIDESSKGTDESEFDVQLAQGNIWVRTPPLEVFSGSIARTITLPRYAAAIPSDAEVVLMQDAVMVFSADGEGVRLTIEDVDDPVYIGEGQQMSIPESISGDPLRLRTAIEPLAVQRAFITDSRRIKQVATGTGVSTPVGDDDVLIVTAPANKTTTTAATVRVEGRVGQRAERVRVNGYEATINREQGTFSQELALKEGGETVFSIEALDARGIVLEKEERTVSRGSQAITPPTIATPAKAGDTYRTQKTEFAITGSVPAGSAGVMVNEYKLQLFRTGDTTWSYLASTALNNLKEGSNVYDIYTLDAAGNKSQPARITILLEPGTEGVIGSTSSAAGSASSAALTEDQLPKNDPLMPGSLAVTGPTAGTAHTATGSEFLIEGTTPKETASVWVNGYRLQLYTPGKLTWNYIAKAEYNTLKPGRNAYRIVARNEKNEILDAFEYTATYNP